MRYKIAWCQAKAGEESLNVSENREDEISGYAKEAAALQDMLGRLSEYGDKDAQLGVWKFVVPEFGEDDGGTK